MLLSLKFSGFSTAAVSMLLHVAKYVSKKKEGGVRMCETVNDLCVPIVTRVLGVALRFFVIYMIAKGMLLQGCIWGL